MSFSNSMLGDEQTEVKSFLSLCCDFFVVKALLSNLEKCLLPDGTILHTAFRSEIEPNKFLVVFFLKVAVVQQIDIPCQKFFQFLHHPKVHYHKRIKPQGEILMIKEWVSDSTMIYTLLKSVDM